MATTSNPTDYFADRYRNKSAQDLSQLAAHADDLVPAAREALQAEISRRPQPTGQPSGSAASIPEAATEENFDRIAGGLFLYCLDLIFAAARVVVVATILIAAKSDLPLTSAIFLYGAAAWNVATAVAIFLRARFALTMVFDQLLMMANIAAFSLGIRLALHFFPDDAWTAAVPLLSNLLLAAETLIWYLYFRKSRRVLATFGRNL